MFGRLFWHEIILLGTRLVNNSFEQPIALEQTLQKAADAKVTLITSDLFLLHAAQ